ncbi:uncharacterized protein BDW70DRAFT_159928 [Aspergillus foveolatus]|uniref:uncharacterized protein n=1 Tax=Aspergillus foveolatus TaxID=210207 RepID=UPI003CCCD8ED
MVCDRRLSLSKRRVSELEEQLAKIEASSASSKASNTGNAPQEDYRIKYQTPPLSIKTPPAAPDRYAVSAQWAMSDGPPATRPRRSTSLADELKMLSLEATAEKYVGPLSGVAFAKLTQAMLRRLAPDQEAFVFGDEEEGSGAGVGDAELLPSFEASSGGSAQGYACDLSSKSAIAELAPYISKAEGGKLDILILNAGIRGDPPVECNVLTAPLLELQKSMFSRTEHDWENTFSVYTTAHYFLCVALLPLLAAAADQDIDGGRSRGAEQGRGVMVITSSCASMHNATNVDLTSYTSRKAATDHLMKLLVAKFARCSRQSLILLLLNKRKDL